MSDWIMEAIGPEALDRGANTVGRDLLSEIDQNARQEPDASFVFLAEALELGAFQLLDGDITELRNAAEEAFEYMRVGIDAHIPHILKTACYGVLADRTPDVARYLRSIDIGRFHAPEDRWADHVLGLVSEVWLKLLRKDGWADLDAVLAGVIRLREQQAAYEKDFLNKAGTAARTTAWQLIACYHLARAAEILAVFSTQGASSGAFDVRQQLEAQFDRAIVACERAELVELYPTVKLLARTAQQLVANSIWTVTRAVNSRVTKFVSQLVSRAQARPMFEMLPPQRVTLREHGLLGSAHRAVVVSLPTSSGKTRIAQFRILQALNQFDPERGWVAYIAPTRALVNQICAQLRRDFQPLGVVVERVSPALEIDGVEAEILTDRDPATEFRVLVGTPEKVDLLLRGGWESKIGRPLTLVVVDEAHNLSQDERGLRLELLLATINRECRNSQFLLLTPFIRNGAEIARWLSPDSCADIGAQFEWKPNDRVIALSQPEKSTKAGDFSLRLSTLHTNRKTLVIDRDLLLTSGRPLGLTWSSVKSSPTKVAAATADGLSNRGTTIVVANNIEHTWSIARTLSARKGDNASRDNDLDFVCDFVADEFGSDFELLHFLKKRIGLHHSGLSDETKALTEWLVEREKISVLVATTTIAQGVNFPVSGVVLAGHQYPYGQEMPPEDFWNLAGRAGRSNQKGLGVVALAAESPEKAAILKEYVRRNVVDLNSTLIEMVKEALSKGRLELQTLFHRKEWSAFLQYLAHSYRQIDNFSEFASQTEQVLRGSFGFQKIRSENPTVANDLVGAVQRYARILNGKPLALVDSTGFSWESVSVALKSIRDEKIVPDMWDGTKLFDSNNSDLARAFGVLFKVPEIRHELSDVIHGSGNDRDLLARIVKDWVHGASIPEIAAAHFSEKGATTDAITVACRSVYGKLIQTASWGLSALQSLTIGDTIESFTEAEKRSIRNLPARIYYGVNTDGAIDLRLLGIPRRAAQPLADHFGASQSTPIKNVRNRLNQLELSGWKKALGTKSELYRRAWQVLEGHQ